MSKIKPLARKSDIVIQEFGSEILIYDLRANKAFNLNQTSTLIWQLSDGDKTIAEIAEDISKKLSSPVNEEFVWLALEQLRKEKLVENDTEIAGLYQGVSRREIIRRVGLGTLVALPLVSSLVAPMAIQAQSGAVCFPGFCRCPNATPAVGSCDGSAAPVNNPANPVGFQIVTTVNCDTGDDSVNNNSCQCVGPFLADGSGNPSATGSPTHKLSTVGCR